MPWCVGGKANRLVAGGDGRGVGEVVLRGKGGGQTCKAVPLGELGRLGVLEDSLPLLGEE